MKINKIKFQNFRIYKGDNEILFSPNSSKNINIVAGKNGFGKTTFLTSLIWVFYGKMMVEVEDKYKKDIKNAGGYEKYLQSLLNRDIKANYELNKEGIPVFSIQIEIKDLSIPSIPCQSVIIKRSYDLRNGRENLEILIDNIESELTKEVGYEVFINDFILPREIAKFFFFDAEKIVTLAEAKSKSELRNLSRAYSEVLGIKKYEDLRKNLEILLVKLRRDSASPLQQEKLNELLETESQLKALLELNQSNQQRIVDEMASYSKQSESLQEKLIREGNGITLEELGLLKEEQKDLRLESEELKSKLKKLMDIAPLVIAGSKLSALHQQLKLENDSNDNSPLFDINKLNALNTALLNKLYALDLDVNKSLKVIEALKETFLEEQKKEKKADIKILLDYSVEQQRRFTAVYDNIKNTFSSQFNSITKLEKNNRMALSRVYQKIKQAEARKDNPLAIRLRDDKVLMDQKVIELSEGKGKLIEEADNLSGRLKINSRILSEYEKNFNLDKTDRQKSQVTQNVLTKINLIIKKIKEDKKYSLQKSILLGLKKIMHKDDFVHNVKVNVIDDVMDIDLLDKNDNIIDKDSLSKGEQQLYATALLKALVDESGIKFPVFIDSPLQKFDKYHSKNIIKEFYPSISEQVVLFPLLEKELSELEYNYLKPNVNKVYIIDNVNGSSAFKNLKVDDLFNEVKREDDVYAN